MAHGRIGMKGTVREATTSSRSANALPSRCLKLAIRPMILAIMLSGWALSAALQAAEPEYEPDVTLVIKEKAFHVLKGGAGEDPAHVGLALFPGQDIILELRNEDKLPHEFVSPLFTMVEFQFWGKATLVYTYTATGIRIEPGERVALRFELPKGFTGKQFKFWCNVHGKLHNDTLQGEIFVVKSKPGTS